MIEFLLFLSGILGGFLAGLLGIGGGIIYITILPIALRQIGIPEDQLVAATIANSLMATFFASLFALKRHYQNNNFFPKQSIAIGIPGAIAALVIYKYLVESGIYNLIYFNLFIIVILLFMLIRQLLKKSSNQHSEDHQISLPSSIVTGFSGGTLASLSGLGGGAIVVPLLLIFGRLDIKKATSISMGFIFVSSLTMTIYSMFFNPTLEAGMNNGILEYRISIPLILGVLLSAGYGVRAAHKISSRNLTIVFSIFIVIVMLSRIIDLIRVI